MNRLTDDQKQALALLAVGAALAALALHPPKWLVKVYLAVEKAARPGRGRAAGRGGRLGAAGAGQRQTGRRAGLHHRV